MIAAFAIKSILEYFKTIDHIFMDGIFSFFTIFLKIHSVENGSYVPIIFCLLLKNTELTYITIY